MKNISIATIIIVDTTIIVVLIVKIYQNYQREGNRIKMFLNIIIRKTGKLRFNFALWLIKYISPSLNRKISPIFYNINILPRPSVKYMKQLFNGRGVVGVEIGVRKGFNAESILEELNVKRLYLIDIWDKKDQDYPRNYKDYRLLLKKYRDDSRVRIIRDYSMNAVEFIGDNSLDFIYIDGAHDYDNVYNDIKSWTPKVKEGGFIAGHDIFNILSVFNAVKDYCLKNKIVFYTKSPDWYFIKGREVN